jgi:hypothetical protein
VNLANENMRHALQAVLNSQRAGQSWIDQKTQEICAAALAIARLGGDTLRDSDYLRRHPEMLDDLAAAEAAIIADDVLQRPEVADALVQRLVPLLAPKVADACRNLFMRELLSRSGYRDMPDERPESPRAARAEVLRWMRELYIEDDDVRAGVGVGSPFDQALCGFLRHLGAFVDLDEVDEDASWTITLSRPKAPVTKVTEVAS